MGELDAGVTVEAGKDLPPAEWPAAAGERGPAVAHVGAEVDEEIDVGDHAEDVGAQSWRRGQTARALAISQLAEEDGGQERTGEGGQRDAEMGGQDLRLLRYQHRP